MLERNISGSATSTSNVGLNLSAGCIAYGGNCISASTFGASTFAYPFTSLNSFGTSTAATTTSILTQGVFFASSTVAASQFPYASSTAFTTGNLFLTNATGTALNLTGSLTTFASSTIGGGGQTTGLTINGGATTTGNAYFGSSAGIKIQPTAGSSLTVSNFSTISPFFNDSSLFTTSGWLTAGGNSGVFGYRSGPAAVQTGVTSALAGLNKVEAAGGSVTFAAGVVGAVAAFSADTIPEAYGVYGKFQAGSAVGTWTDTAAIAAEYGFKGATTTNAYGIRIKDMTFGGGAATSTNTYGLYIGDVTPGNGLVQTNRPYGLYSVDANANNYFGGSLGIGTTSPFAQLSVFAGGDYTAKAASTLFAVGSSSAGTATSTFFSINSAGSILTNLGSGLVKSTSGVLSLATAGTDYTAFAWPFTPATNFGTNTSATTSSIWLQGGSFFSSSTVASVLPFASTTALTVSGANGLSLGSLNGLLKATNGQVATAVAGTDYAAFAYPFTSLNSFGTSTAATTTSILTQGVFFASSTVAASQFPYASSTAISVSGLSFLNGGLLSLASSTIGNGNQNGGLTINGGATTTGNAYFGGNITLADNKLVGVSSLSLMFNASNSAFDYLFSGVNRVRIGSSYVSVNNGGAFRFSSDTQGDGTADTGISRSAAGILAIGNGTAGNASGGFLALASSTIGNGNQNGGLTINGGATTTGNAYFSGGVGIGVANTQSGTLSVSGSASIGSANSLYFGDGQSSNYIGQNNGGSTNNPMFSGFTSVNLGINGVTKLKIDSSGNVGVGTTSPFAQLAVFAGGDYLPHAASTLFAIGSSSAGTATSTFFSINSAGSILTNLGTGLVKSTSGVLSLATAGTDYAAFSYPFTSLNSFGTSTAATTTSILTQGVFFASSTVAASQFPYASSTALTAGNLFFTNATGTALNLTGSLTAFASSTIGNGTQTGGLTINGGATTTGNAYFAGLVGIGTVAPAFTLDVNGGIRATAGIRGTNLYTTSAGAVNTPSLTYFSDASTGFWWPSAGVLAVSTLGNERMRFDAAGNVGIGTTSPQYLLSLASTTAPQLSLSAGAGLAQWTFRNAGGNLYFATTSVAGTATSTTPALTITGSRGNVGIGTTSPAAHTKLSLVSTDTSITGDWTGGSNHVSYGLFNDLTVAPTSNLGTTEFRDSSYADVSVPTTNTFSIGGITGMQGEAYNGGSGTVNSMNAIGSWAENFGVTTVTGLYGALFGARNDIGTTTNLYGTSIYVDNTGGTTTNMYGLQMYMDNVGGRITNRYGVYIDGSGTPSANDYGVYQLAGAKNYFAGNVGIGTTSPGSALSIQGNIFLAGNLVSTSSIASIIPFASSTAISAGTICISTDCRTAWPSGGSGAFPFTPTTNFGALANSTGTPILLTAGLQASSTVRFGNAGQNNIIFDNGLFAFGTTTDSNDHVRFANYAGSGRFDLSLIIANSSQYAEYNTKDENNNFKWSIGSNGDNQANSAASNLFYIGQSTDKNDAAVGLTRLAITDAGNVGIATETPPWTLTSFSQTAPQLSLSAGAGIAQWAFRNAGGNLYLATTSVAGTATTSTSAFTILNNGNVGIGTTNPANKLEVVGNTYLQGTLQTTGNVTLPTGGLLNLGSVTALFNNGTTDLYMGYNSSNLEFRTNTIEQARIDTNGNFGIGTTSPFAKLAVFAGGDYLPHAASTLFAIGSSSAGTATTTLFSVNSAGNVGINTAPQGAFGLVVGGGFRATGDAYFDNSFVLSGGTTQVFNLNNHNLDFIGGGNVTYDNTGYVGIGTSTPAPVSGLTIASTTGAQLSLSAGAGSSQWVLRNAGSSFYIATTTVAGNATSSIAAFRIDSNGIPRFASLGGATGCAQFDTTGQLSNTGTACGTGGGTFSWTPGTAFGTAVNATGTALQLQGGLFASSTVRFGNAGVPGQFLWSGSLGFLGLGTSTPLANLSIQSNYGSTNSNLFTIASSTAADGSTATTLFNLDNVGNATFGNTAGTGDASEQFASDNNAWLIGYASTDKSFRIASSTGFTSNVAFTIKKTNLNVGISSTSPWGLLSVNASGVTGPAFAVGSSTKTSFIITNNNNSGFGTTSPWGKLSIDTTLSDNGAPTFVIGSSSRTDLVVTQSGNVSIGTTDTTGKLTVDCGSTDCIGLHLKQSNAGIQFSAGGTIRTFNTSATDINYDAGNHIFLTSDTEKMRLANNGNLGIGTTTPGSKLSIQGNIFLAGNLVSTSSAASILPFASTTAITATTASSTNLIVSSAGGAAGCAQFSVTGLLSNTGTACGTGSGGSAFTFGTNTFGTSTAATTTSLWTQGVFFASSTKAASQFPYASSTAITVTGTSFLGNILATASSTIGSGTQAGGLTINGGATTTGDLAVWNPNLGSLSFTISANGIGAGNAYAGLPNAQLVYNTNCSGVGCGVGVPGGKYFDLWNGNSSNSTADASFLATASNNLAVFTGGLEALRIDSQQRIGIGTTTPTNTLTIASSTVPQLSLSAGAGIAQWAFRNAGGNLYFATTTVAGTATTTSSALTIIGSSGNVGIGTTTAPYTLTVAGDVTGSRVFASTPIASGAVGTGIALRPDDLASSRGFNQIVSLGNGGNYGLQFVGGASNGLIDPNSWSIQPVYMTITSTGNVGIGTTSPYAKLSVVGEIVGQMFTATSTTATSTFAGGLNVGSGALTYDYSSGLTSINNLAIGSLTFDADSGVVTWADMPVTSASATGTVEAYTARIDGTPLLTLYSEADGMGGLIASSTRVGVGTTTPWGQLSVNPNAIGTGPAFVIGSSTKTNFLITNAGNVGIGTTTPISALHIVEASNPGSSASGSNWPHGLTITTGVNGQSLFMGYDSSADAAYINADKTNFIRPIGLQTRGGGVGIGTTSPNWILDITSTNSSQLALSADTGVAEWAFRNAAGNLFISTTTVAGTATTTLSAFTINGATGNIGVGTSSPIAKLAVQGNGTGTNVLVAFANSVYTTVMQILENGTAYFLGNLGVGTTTPWRKFSVTDTVSNPQIAVAYDNTRYATFQVDSTGDLTVHAQANDLYLNDDNFWACSSGCPSGNPTGTGNVIAENKVGVGTTTPAAKLTIETQDSTTDFVQVASSTAQNIFNIKANGKIGVATSSPFAKFSIGAGGALVVAENNLTDGATIAIDWLQGNQQRVVLGGNRTITFANFIAGQGMRLILCQDGTGSRTITAWPSNILWQGGGAPTLTATANKCDIVSFIASNATSTLTILGSAVLNF